LEAHNKFVQQQQQEQQEQQQCLLGPEDLSRVVLALSKLGYQPEEQQAQTLLLATQVG
jgi:Holliday junction resolvasome RuvABC DNA-binding subunit